MTDNIIHLHPKADDNDDTIQPAIRELLGKVQSAAETGSITSIVVLTIHRHTPDAVVGLGLVLTNGTQLPMLGLLETAKVHVLQSQAAAP